MIGRWLLSQGSGPCTAAIAVVGLSTLHAQDGAAGVPIPTLPFHLVENFFHYPAYSVIGRLSGVAVASVRL